MSDPTDTPTETSTAPTPADVPNREPAQAPEGAEPKGDAWSELFKGEDPNEVRRALDESRKWERRSKENRTEADTLAERVQNLEQAAAEAEARAARRDVAIEFGLTKDDAALLDKITDEDAMRALAGRLSEAADKGRVNYVPTEGRTPSASSDPRREFLRELMGRNT